jgi:hypothetical protein
LTAVGRACTGPPDSARQPIALGDRNSEEDVMIIIRSSGARTASAPLRSRAAILAGALVLATSVGPFAAGSSSARTFEYGSPLVQHQLSPGFACAMRRALAGRQVSCS